jgi:hypothetical protein
MLLGLLKDDLSDGLPMLKLVEDERAGPKKERIFLREALFPLKIEGGNENFKTARRLNIVGGNSVRPSLMSEPSHQLFGFLRSFLHPRSCCETRLNGLLWPFNTRNGSTILSWHFVDG